MLLKAFLVEDAQKR